MKLMVNILLFVFLAVIAAPTVLSLIQDDADVVTACNMEEEETQKELQEIKAGPTEFLFTLVPVITKKTKITSNNLRCHIRVSGDIFLPPPEAFTV